jgi:hypothetical protein
VLSAVMAYRLIKQLWPAHQLEIVLEGLLVPSALKRSSHLSFCTVIGHSCSAHWRQSTCAECWQQKLDLGAKQVTSEQGSRASFHARTGN